MTQEKDKYRKDYRPSLPDFGKMPPQNVELEQVVLGAILLEKDAIFNIIDIILPECFYKDSHQKIFSAALNLFSENKPIDILTVTEQLMKSGKLDEVGGPVYISKLTDRVGSSANLEYHAKIIYEKYVYRSLIRISTEMQNKSYQEVDFKDLIDYAQIEMFNLIQKKGKRSRRIGDIGAERIAEIVEFSEKKLEFTGVETGFKKVDNITSGWQPGELIILAARPSMGKTSIAVEFCIRTAKKNKVVDIYSLEMKDKQLYDKALSSEVKISNTILRTGNLNDQQWERIDNMKSNVDKLDILIDDTPALSITDFSAKARRNNKEYKTDLIVIDYLQLMKSYEAYRMNGRVGEVSDISAKLKMIAKELDVPIIALSQLTRDVDKRGGDKIPQLSDLKESGSIEQDADVVIFIHRPEYYGEMQTSKGDTVTNLIQLIFAKNRNGRTGSVKIWKNEDWTDFRETEHEEKYAPTGNDSDDLPF